MKFWGVNGTTFWTREPWGANHADVAFQAQRLAIQERRQAILTGEAPCESERERLVTLRTIDDLWSDYLAAVAELRAGTIDREQWEDVLSGIARSPGHCMTMGTASTMACMVEALGVGMPGNAAIPAVDARRNVLASLLPVSARTIDVLPDCVLPKSQNTG